MERLYCPTCDQPTFHQTTNFYGEYVTIYGNRCLTCGEYSKPQKATTLETIEATIDAKSLRTGD